MGIIKLLVLDLDGTLLNEKKEISRRNRDVLLRAQEEKGLRIAIGSGRDYGFAAKVAAPLELDTHRGFLICNNGQKVYDCEKKEITVIGRISNTGARRAMAYAQQHHLEIKGTIDEKVFFHSCHEGKTREGSADQNYDKETGFFDTAQDFDKIVLFTPKEYTLDDDHEACTQLQALLGEYDDLTLVAPHVIDLLAKGVDKTSGIACIEEKLGLQKEEILVMGDGENDLPAARKYPFSAMANSMDAVRTAASRMTLSNEEDGVAYEVERSILNV